MVRQDDESVAARRAGAIEFERLSSPEFRHDADDAACLQAWRVACLVDNPESREVATELARTILATDPANYRVMTWVIGRDLDVPITPSVGHLERRLTQDLADLEEIVALVAAYASEGKLSLGKEVLEQHKKAFATDPAQLVAILARSTEKNRGRKHGGSPHADRTKN